MNDPTLPKVEPEPRELDADQMRELELLANELRVSRSPHNIAAYESMVQGLDIAGYCMKDYRTIDLLYKGEPIVDLEELHWIHHDYPGHNLD